MMTVCMLGQGQMFGEMDLVFRRQYQFSLRSIENDSAIYLMDSKDFEKLIRKNKDIYA